MGHLWRNEKPNSKGDRTFQYSKELPGFTASNDSFDT